MSLERIYHLGIKAIIQNSQSQVLILKHRAQGFWDIPGGRVTNDHTPEKTLLREVYEETGLTDLIEIIPQKMVLTPFMVPAGNGQKAGLILWYHTCYLATEQSIVLSDEHSEYQWTDWIHARQLLSASFPLDLDLTPRASLPRRQEPQRSATE